MKKKTVYTKTCSRCGFTPTTREAWKAHMERDVLKQRSCNLAPSGDKGTSPLRRAL